MMRVFEEKDESLESRTEAVCLEKYYVVIGRDYFFELS
jgi:hypothetical protein